MHRKFVYLDMWFQRYARGLPQQTHVQTITRSSQLLSAKHVYNIITRRENIRSVFYTTRGDLGCCTGLTNPVKIEPRRVGLAIVFTV